MMKKFTGTWIVVGLLAALVLWIVVIEPKTREEAKEADLTLVSSDREKLEKVEITNAGGTFVLEKKDDAWRITAPRDLPVEESSLNLVKNALESLVASDRVWPSGGAEEREKAGLTKPAATITYAAADKSGTLEVGRQIAKNETFYVAASGKPGIYTARIRTVEIFTKGLPEFRRKKLVEIDRDKVRTLILEAPGREPLMLMRADTLAPWIASTPFAGRADRGRANGLLTRLSNLRAEEFVDTPPREAGLDGLRGSITVTADGGTTATVLIGAVTTGSGDAQRLFVREGERGQVAITKDPIAADLADPFTAWRDKQLFDFFADDVSAVDLVLDKGPLHVVRNDDRMFATSGGTPVVVNTEASRLLRAARDAAIVEFGPDAAAGSAKSRELGLEKPLVLARWTELGRTTELAIGAAKAGTALRWVRTSESATALLVDVEPIVQAAAALAAAPSATPTPAPPTAPPPL